MKIFVHIGYYKTGTTALQHFLDINRAALRAKGICYPEAGRPANDLGSVDSRLPQLSVLSLGLLESVGAHVPEWYRRGKAREPHVYDAREQWQNVISELHASDCPIGFISSEEFVRFGEDPGHQKLVDFVSESLGGFDVSILCYLRRPDLYLESWYNQLIKMGVRVPRLRANLGHYTKTIHVDFMKALRPWIEAFGQDRVLIRNYEPIKSKPFGILSDLAEFFAIDLDQGHFDLNVPANPSIPNALVELKRLSNRWNKTSHEFHRTNRALHFLENNWELPANHHIEILDTKSRFLLTKAFRSSHEQLSELKGDGSLFFPTLEDAIFDRTGIMTDTEAAVKYAGIFQFVLSNMP